MLQRVTPETGALGRTLAGDVELVAHRRRVVRKPGIVRAVERIRAVEHQRAQALAVTQREHLREVAAVRVPVQVDAGDAERLEQRGQIVARERAAVERRTRAEGGSAGADVGLGECWGVLQLAAVDGAGAPGAAIIHEQHVTRGAQRREQR